MVISPSCISNSDDITYTDTVDIPPITSFLVHIDATAAYPNLKIVPSMMVDFDGSPSSAPLKGKQAVSINNMSQLFITATLNGLRSHCTVVEMSGASNEYDL